MIKLVELKEKRENILNKIQSLKNRIDNSGDNSSIEIAELEKYIKKIDKEIEELEKEKINPFKLKLMAEKDRGLER